MDTVDFPRFIFAFIFVIGLIAIMGWVLKRYSNSQKIFSASQTEGRLQIVEMRFLDPRRKLLLVRRDDTEHLILLADGRELLIETNIKPPTS